MPSLDKGASASRTRLRAALTEVPFPLVGLSERYTGPRWFSFWQLNMPADSHYHVDLGHGEEREGQPLAVTVTMPRLDAEDSGHTVEAAAFVGLLARGTLISSAAGRTTTKNEVSEWVRWSEDVAVPHSVWRTAQLDVDGDPVPTRVLTDHRGGCRYTVEVLTLPRVFVAVYSRDLEVSAVGGLATGVRLDDYP